MLANGSLFTWLFQGTPFAMWRQLIWIIGLIILYKYSNIVNFDGIRKILKILFVFFVINVFQALFTFAVYNFNPLRITYTFWAYYSGVPFLLFPYLFICSKGEKSKRHLSFLNIYIYLGIFLTVGFITDRVLGGIITKFLLLRNKESILGMIDDGRFCFLSESPTIFGVYYCFCMICTLYRLYISDTNKTKLILFVVAFSYVIGGWMTGSRQIVLALGVVLLLPISYYTFFVRDKKTYLPFAITILLFSFTSVFSFLYSDKAYERRFSSSTIKKDNRSQLWKKGFKENVSDNVAILYFRKAFGLAHDQKWKKGEIKGPNYENTYYLRISEIGITGVFLLLLPFLFLIFCWDGFDFFNVCLLSFYISYMVISYISPNGGHQTTQMVVFMALGMNLIKDEFKREKMPLA